MSNNHLITPDSPESDHVDQSNFDFSEDCFTFDDDGWLELDFPDQAHIISGPIQINPVNQASTEVNNYAGTGTGTGTSSLLQGRPAGNILY